MSSTNRSEARKKHTADYYITPHYAIEDFFKEFKKYERISCNKILDPCAGGDSKNVMSYPYVINKLHSGYKVDTIDIREDSRANIKNNYLNIDCKNKYNIIITNPPFNLALEIITKALEDVRDNGYVIMLLRLNFFGSQARKDFWQNNMPKYAFIHSKRLGFVKDSNKTDSIEYCHVVWQKGYKTDFIKTKVI